GAVLRDIEAGKTQTPDMLFVDDRSAAAVDADRATGIARDTSYAHRRPGRSPDGVALTRFAAAGGGTRAMGGPDQTDWVRYRSGSR
ncbi:hypothetical protein, partial [Nocardia neocaledoniensis]|uniref:hypothetical protein n=1 Tax=Nocardia neocaledoniensis TaxID=236511 RepID=UPI002458E1BE